jgi:hypothetical protein
LGAQIKQVLLLFRELALKLARVVIFQILELHDRFSDQPVTV